jgi:Mg2+ and Co2+ transporter CorA
MLIEEILKLKIEDVDEDELAEMLGRIGPLERDTESLCAHLYEPISNAIARAHEDYWGGELESKYLRDIDSALAKISETLDGLRNQRNELFAEILSAHL